MKETTRCPICNAPDILDYTKENVICRVCNTDLSVFMLLEEGRKKTQKTESKKNYFLIILVFIFLIIGIVYSFSLYYKSNKTNIDLSEKVHNLENENHILKEKSEKTVIVNNYSFKYSVRKGDSFWLISQKFFGTGRKANKIAQDNNLTLEDKIHEGIILIIKQ